MSSTQRAVREHEILRVSAAVSCTEGCPEIRDVRRSVLTWVQKKAGSPLPMEAWEGQSYEHLAGGRHTTAVRLVNGDTDIWAVRAEDPDKNIPGRTWITEFVLGSSAASSPKISIRLFAATIELHLNDIAPHTPAFMQNIANLCELSNGQVEVLSYPIRIENRGHVDGLIDLLLDETRRTPIFVVSLEDGAFEPVLDVNKLARAVLGLASVVVLPGDLTWHLTQKFGKRLSVFSGAIRAYMPGFSEDSDAYAHPLDLAENITAPGGPRRCGEWLQRLAASYSLRHLVLGREVLDFKTVRTEALKIEQSKLKADASDLDRTMAALKQNAALESQLEDAKSQLDYFAAEHESAELRAEEAERELRNLRYAYRTLANVEKNEPLVAQAEADPDDWSELAGWCDRAFAGRLILTSNARREIRQPAFNDVGLVIRCLKWLAGECRECLIEGGTGSLRDKPVEQSIWNAPCGEDSYEVSYRNRCMIVAWHIKTGGNTRDPSRCLRIYYFWDDEAEQIVISHMPSHRRTGAS